MSDFEKRLSDALASGAESAPGADGLAEGARQRSRRRRRTTVAVAAAAVVAAVAVPVGVVALRDGSDGPPSADDPVGEETPADPDTRIETWHDLQIEVPAEWGYGGRTAWCTGGEAETPVVERPGGVVPMIACSPTYSLGVSFGDGAAFDPAYPSGHVWQYEAGDVAEYPPGSWLGYWYDDDDVVQIAAADKDTAQAIIGSVQRVATVDGNGCPVVDDGGVGEGPDGSVTVCRYDGAGQLVQSERLTGNDAVRARAAVEGAAKNSGGLRCANGPTDYVVMTVERIRVDVQYAGQLCVDRGVFTDGERRQLTPTLLYWALSPGWSGGVQGWVPLPDELRQVVAPEPTEPVKESRCPDGYYANSDFRIDPDPGGPLVACRMEVDWDGESGGTYLLAEAVELSEAESDAVRSAIAAASTIAGESDFKGCRRGSGEFYLVLAEAPKVAYWIYNGECGPQRVLSRGQQPREVTADLLDALGSPYGLLR